MKKLYAIILFCLPFFVQVSQAQIPTNCNGQFTFTTSGNTITCVPANSGSAYFHQWSFGDGSGSTLSNPVHTYTNCGTYTVFHYLEARNPNGVIICADSSMMTVVIACNTPCNSVANFTSSNLNNQPNIFLFTNTSIIAPNTSVVCNWNFGDGTSSTTQGLANQTHTYANSGNYNVCLVVTSGVPGTTNICRDTFCTTVQVQASPTPCSLIPTISVQNSPNQSNVFIFSNTTITANAPAVTWNFGDGTSGSGQVVTHVYSTPGTYTVCMFVAVSNTCTADTCITVTVTGNNPQPCNLQANFTYTNSGLTYNFTNTSAGFSPGDTIRWVFSNGTVTNVQNPVVTFPGPGVYQVCLRVKKPATPGAAPCVSEACDTITVAGAPCNLNPSFNAQASTTQAGLYVFTNTTPLSNTQAAITWNFGDGTSGSGPVVTHVYSAPGTYTVCMFVAVSNTCTADTCITVTVTGNNPQPCNLQANFNWQQTPNAPNVFYFLNTTTGFSPGDSIRWNFGDGTVGFMSNPVHTYPQAGTYNVCIRVSKPVSAGTAPCVSEICRTITISSTPGTICDSIQTTFTFAYDYYVPNKVYFYTISNIPVNQEQWTIRPLNNTGSVVTINQYNPAYVFNSTGDYQVCLNATTINGCVKTYCDTIIISSVASQCMLAAYPNPATTQVSVNAVLSAPSNIYAYLFNSQNILLRQRVQAGMTGNNVLSFNTSTLPAGYYTIRLYYNNQVCVARFQKL